ncbi:hypothetical protein, partial [Escherichia coli]|uniref:hypothetical protein n=1 Tax=Escherichia coli TaxID=562 RepID=UPI00197FC72D
GEKRVFLVILFTSFSGSLVSRIPGAVQSGVESLHGVGAKHRIKCMPLIVSLNALSRAGISD